MQLFIAKSLFLLFQSHKRFFTYKISPNKGKDNREKDQIKGFRHKDIKLPLMMKITPIQPPHNFKIQM